ncbi:MAG: hypothetical protein LBP87_12305 [Planctomycetaceae bacterium]|jgi:hypothetical protein|nr:hypothetical protein [Planctomycetaceae bacterium]
MNHNALFSLAKNIKPYNVRKYLLAKGWKEVKKMSRKDIFLFNHPKNKQQQIVFPSEDDYQLYPEDLLIAVNRLQEYEQRDIASILTQLSNPDADILRYRIQSQQAESGSLSLTVVNRFISGVIDSLRAAISDNQYPKTAHHYKMNHNLVTQTLEHAQFGQTELGSFVVKIIAPVDIADEDNTLEDMRSRTIRNGIVHLLKSTSQIVNAVQKNTTQLFIDKIKNKPLFSNNLVNALVDLQLWDDATIELSTEWAPVLPEKKVPSQITILPHYFQEIEKISRLITPPVEKQNIEFFTGFVVDLEGETNEHGKKEGYVHLQVSSYDKDSFKTVAWLNENDHTTAIRAYKENLPVTFSGKLVRHKNYKREILDVGFFKLCLPEKLN